MKNHIPTGKSTHIDFKLAHHQTRCICLQVARLGVPYVLMHIRGNPGTMQLPQNKEYSDGVCKGVAMELALTAQRAVAAGIEPWRLILDPGDDS